MKRNQPAMLVKAFVLTCLVFSYSALPQDTADNAMEPKALAALAEELKGVVSRTAPNKNEAKMVSEKWDKREDLAGKTQNEVVDLLYADVESVIKDSETRYQLISMFSFYERVPFTSKDKPANGLAGDSRADKPMEAEALAALLEELKGVVSRTAPNKNEAKQVAEKWDKREDLDGKTRKQVIDLLYADVESVIKDSETQYQLFSMFSFYKGIGAGSPKKSNPQLIDEFQLSNCEDMLARMDNYFVQLQNDPNSKGYIVTYGKPFPRRAAERRMKNAVRDKGLDRGRLVFASTGGGDGNAKISLWLVPQGADAPEISPSADSDGDIKISAETEPYIFGQEFAGDLGGCSEYDPEFYAEVMKANPASRGNIVIYETSRTRFAAAEKAILSMLTGTGIAPKRLRAFYVEVRPESLREGIELWLLP